MDSKFAVVTGASSGIGGAIAVELASAGYFIALVGRDQTRLSQVAKLVEGVGGKSQIFQADLAVSRSIPQLISDIRTATDHIDVLVNAAAIWHGENEVYANHDFVSFSDQVVTDTLTVGLLAPTMLCHGLLPLMRAKSKIINISGTFESGAKGWLPYYVSKKGIEDLTVGLAEELQDQDIQVNAISPSDTATPAYRRFFPEYIEDSLDPKEIGLFAAKLCSSEYDSITGKVFVLEKDAGPYDHFHK